MENVKTVRHIGFRLLVLLLSLLPCEVVADTLKQDGVDTRNTSRLLQRNLKQEKVQDKKRWIMKRTELIT